MLIELFEREFVESQEALGMTLVGQFRDLDNSDRFVWLRGFPDMTTRGQALQKFYSGSIWKAHREKANETMIDSDNVLLLRPARPGSGFSIENVKRQPKGASENGRGIVEATICHLKVGTREDVVDFFERTIQPALTEAGASPRACFVTESHPNTFPALPVREQANVLVWFSGFPEATAYERHMSARAESPRWKSVFEDLADRFVQTTEILRLQPTPRSRLHG